MRNLSVTDHAWRRHCQRVAVQTRTELRRRVQQAQPVSSALLRTMRAARPARAEQWRRDQTVLLADDEAVYIVEVRNVPRPTLVTVLSVAMLTGRSAPPAPPAGGPTWSKQTKRSKQNRRPRNNEGRRGRRR